MFDEVLKNMTGFSVQKQDPGKSMKYNVGGYIGEISDATEDQDFTITFNVEDIDSGGTIVVGADNSSNINVDDGGNSTSTYTQGTTSHSVVITPDDNFDGIVNVVITAISTDESSDRTCTKLQFLYKDSHFPVYYDIFYDDKTKNKIDVP